MTEEHVDTLVYGVDFTSAPRRAKAITVARGVLKERALHVRDVARLESFEAFDEFLNTPGPWIGGFDFPFGLPRELVQTLHWPEDWRSLVEHVRAIGKESFKESLDRVRESRPVGSKYIERKGDKRAGSSSPMKLVNPPVGLMFFEGAARLASAGVSVIPCSPAHDTRVALEAYPGYLARQITRESYKKDGREGNTPKRVSARERIVSSLSECALTNYKLSVSLNDLLTQECVTDGSGDTLDAVLCCIQAAAAVLVHRAGDPRYGISTEADDFEGWIITVN
jgi:hypothetical protein